MTDNFLQEKQRESTPISGLGNIFNFDISKSSLLEETMPRRTISPVKQATPFQIKPWLEETQHYELTGELHIKNYNENRQIFSPQRTSANISRADKVINDRITLLARKYAEKSTLTGEENARLAIVTEQVRKLVPSVSAKQEELLGDALERIKTISQANLEITSGLKLEDK